MVFFFIPQTSPVDQLIFAMKNPEYFDLKFNALRKFGLEDLFQRNNFKA
jgi:hypothetical protein